ncbi:hypothetical protein JCM19000A_24470 [Silvimonas sp. JCM 19000]
MPKVINKKGRLISAFFLALLLHLIAVPFWHPVNINQGRTAPAPHKRLQVHLQTRRGGPVAAQHSDAVKAPQALMAVAPSVTTPPAAVAASAIAQVDPTARQLQSPFIDAGSLDIKPLPGSNPDFKSVLKTPGTGLPVLLRIYVLPNGEVYRVTITQADPEDKARADALITAFKNTRFIPGRLNGKDAATWLDLQFDFTPPVSKIDQLNQ